ncbi:MAG: hypothetical protein WA849_16530 [Candidatus Udaeobacter sp.]
MKHFIVAIFLCIAFFTLVNAAQRKIAYECGEKIFVADLDGNVLKKWELSKILTDASMNSGDRLSISPDGNTLLMDVDCGSEHERKNWDRLARTQRKDYVNTALSC